MSGDSDRAVTAMRRHGIDPRLWRGPADAHQPLRSAGPADRACVRLAGASPWPRRARRRDEPVFRHLRYAGVHRGLRHRPDRRHRGDRWRRPDDRLRPRHAGAASERGLRLGHGGTRRACRRRHRQFRPDLALGSVRRGPAARRGLVPLYRPHARRGHRARVTG
ncbi:hypothetical protein RB2654_14585 [Rhodobacterales bacterium HTCC2654]|uniref:Uncharacterized protein n=1 Tax=Maritimibacter alkaliphilus HTCC2654 TaxID=314271 RepID=A3VGW6_9RHOB|nr:hypothetical protein RB2654_14585 [Rhodobacterales bacterium HTCC2654] [Maritimibacter alkaliphilus HTCC2654]